MSLCSETGKDLQPLWGASREVQLGGVANEVDGAVVEAVPGGVACGAIIVHVLVAGVVWLLEALVEGHTTLSTCNAPSLLSVNCCVLTLY